MKTGLCCFLAFPCFYIIMLVKTLTFLHAFWKTASGWTLLITNELKSTWYKNISVVLKKEKNELWKF